MDLETDRPVTNDEASDESVNNLIVQQKQKHEKAKSTPKVWVRTHDAINSKNCVTFQKSAISDL